MTAARRRRRLILRAALALIAAAGGYYWFTHKDEASAATAYGARIACSCRHVDNRVLDRCREDFLPGMGLVMLSEDEEENSVSAWLPFFGGDTAQYREGAGCVLDSWED
jgi:hypothetical protein